MMRGLDFTYVSYKVFVKGVHLGSGAVGGVALVMVEASAVTREGRIHAGRLLRTPFSRDLRRAFCDRRLLAVAGDQVSDRPKQQRGESLKRS